MSADYNAQARQYRKSILGSIRNGSPALWNGTWYDNFVDVPSEEEIASVLAEGVVRPPLPAGIGPAGATGFQHNFTDAVEVVVNHNMGQYPVVAVMDAGGNVLIAEVVNVSVNQLRVYFAAPMSGIVRCVSNS